MDLTPLCQGPDMNRPLKDVKVETSLDDSDTEYYWSSEVVDSGSERSFKREFSLQQNPGKGVKQGLQVKIKVKPDGFFPNKNDFKKEKKFLDSVLKPQQSHLKSSGFPNKEDNVAHQCANLLCRTGGPEVQVAILTKICQLLRTRIQMSPEAASETAYLPVTSYLVPKKLQRVKEKAIILVSPLLDEVFKMASDLTWNRLQSTLRPVSVVGWTDVIPRSHLHSRNSGMKPARVGNNHHGGEEMVEKEEKRRREGKTGRETRYGKETV